MNSAEKKQISRLLEYASDLAARRICNDWSLDNTDDNWQMVQDMHAWANDKDMPMPARPIEAGKKIIVMDWMLMDYLASKLGAEMDAERQLA